MATSPCPQCGTQVERGTTEFCPDCGYYLTWVEEPEPDEPAVPMTRRPGEQEEPAPQPADAPTTPLGPACPACDEPNPPGRQYCEQCGAPLAPEPEPAPEPKQPRRGVPVWAWAAGGAVLLALVGMAAFLVVGPDPATVAEEPAAAAGAETEPPVDPTPEEPTPEEPASEPEVLNTPDVEAQRLAAPPTIDGDLYDWDGITAAYLSAHVVHRDRLSAEDDSFRVEWRLGWDDEHLYVAVEVEDAVHVQTQTADQIWQGDSVDLHVNSAYGAPHDLADQLNEHHFQLIMSPGDFADLPPSAALLRGLHGGGTHFQTVRHGELFDLAAQPLGPDGGYTLEAAIPWDLLEVVPEPGLTLGAALNANDNDRPGEAAQEVMVSNAPERRLSRPATWGTLTLVPGP